MDAPGFSLPDLDNLDLFFPLHSIRCAILTSEHVVFTFLNVVSFFFDLILSSKELISIPSSTVLPVF